MDKVDPELQNIKVQLVVLAEYLQCDGLTDAQVVLYARELYDLGPEGVSKAIEALKADPSVWSGRFPLPAKLRSYLTGDINELVAQSVSRIMACSTVAEIYKLPKIDYDAARDYGITTIVFREIGDAPTMFAQLRDLLKARYSVAIKEKQLGFTGDRPEIGTAGGPRLADTIKDDGGRLLETGPGSTGRV